MSTAALVLGIIALCGCFIPGIGWAGSVCGVLAIIFGAISHNKVGIILGVISLTLGIILTVACVVCAGGAMAGLSSLDF